jgi:hypothetical protein
MDGSRSEFIRIAYSGLRFGDLGSGPTQTFDWIPQSWTNFRNGGLNKNYRAQIAQGLNATTIANGQICVAEYRSPSQSLFWDTRASPQDPIIHQYYYVIGPWNLIWTGPNTVHGVPDPTAQAEAKAISALYKKLWQAHHQLQGGTVLGEIHKTAQMLSKSARFLSGGVFKYLAEARKLLNPKKKRDSLRKITDLYLETVFGWQPLIFDCKDAAIALGRLSHESDKTAFRATALVELPQATPLVSSVREGNHFWVKTQKWRSKATVKYYGHLKALPYEEGHPPAERIVSLSGFDLRSFIPTVWELIPYSFLIDYFTNIGDCLYAFSFDHDYVKCLSHTVVRESDYREDWSPDFTASMKLVNDGAFSLRNATCTGKAGFSSVKLRTFSRGPMNSLPYLLPALTLGDLGGKQMLNIAALLIGDRAKASRTGWS